MKTILFFLVFSFSITAQDRVKEFKHMRDFIIQGMKEMQLDNSALYAGIYLRMISSQPQIKFDDRSKNNKNYSLSKELITFRTNYWDGLSSFDAKLFVTLEQLLGVIGYEAVNESVKLSQKIINSDYYKDYFEKLEKLEYEKRHQPIQNLCYGVYKISGTVLEILNHQINKSEKYAEFDLAKITSPSISREHEKTSVKCHVFDNYADVSYTFISSFNGSLGVGYRKHSVTGRITFNEKGTRVFIGSMVVNTNGEVRNEVVQGYGN